MVAHGLVEKENAERDISILYMLVFKEECLSRPR